MFTCVHVQIQHLAVFFSSNSCTTHLDGDYIQCVPFAIMNRITILILCRCKCDAHGMRQFYSDFPGTVDYIDKYNFRIRWKNQNGTTDTRQTNIRLVRYTQNRK